MHLLSFSLEAYANEMSFSDTVLAAARKAPLGSMVTLLYRAFSWGAMEESINHALGVFSGIDSRLTEKPVRCLERHYYNCIHVR